MSKNRSSLNLLRNAYPALILLVTTFFLWEGYAYLLEESTVIPKPHLVLIKFVKKTPLLMRDHLVPTLKRIGFGYLIGLFGGTLIGVAISLNTYVYRAFFPFLEFFRALPATALFPFFMAVLGNNDLSRMSVAIYITIWITAFNTSRAMFRVGRRRKEYLQTIGASRLFMIRHLYLYELLPSFMTSARVTLSLTLLVMAAVEMLIGATSGLGKDIYNSHYLMDYPGMNATILMVGFIGLILNKITEKGERKVIFWSDE